MIREHWQTGGIGDVNSNARGSGARYNASKVPIELIPLRLIAEQFELVTADDDPLNRYIGVLWNLALFQEGGDATYLRKAIECIGPAWDECAAVFDYGRRKYAEWNWAKGMQWSIPLACAARHLVFGIMAGEEADPESTLSHRGHFLCNIVMLLTFIRTYPEGDDRPSQWLRDPAMTEHTALEDDARLIQQSNGEVA
ncbi:dATP/dGTP diphosphohydrolase domain-containing protein [Burkholderia ubonensis]|uniref:dATP/dGTP diphosphohydrolase domain-containing protein n=1 Tax=Burkholderia ubonensis TaxID=101571 RepID=UPI0007534742|nr:dATP/dGTP diphosphohydrolase domain-containing protein [Burkholderia ubonensis]KVC81407.1 hypothetical protein WI75_08655 [Burkholderia ubonensis]